MGVAHRIYAEALLGAAKDGKELPKVRDEFAALAAALEASEEFGSVLKNPQIDSEAKAAALDTSLGGATKTFRNFLRLVAEKSRIGELDEIYREWEKLLAAEDRILTLELTTAVELSDAEARKIVNSIAKATGRKVEATRSVDPELIGGVIVQAGSLRLDGSVRGRLNGLRDELLARA